MKAEFQAAKGRKCFWRTIVQHKHLLEEKRERERVVVLARWARLCGARAAPEHMGASALDSPTRWIEMRTPALLVLGMSCATVGVAVAVTLFVVSGHTTTLVCDKLDTTRGGLCENDRSVKVSLPTLSFTAILDPERWFFVYGLCIAGIFLGIAYIGLYALYERHVIAVCNGQTYRKHARGCGVGVGTLGWPFCCLALGFVRRVFCVAGFLAPILLIATAAVTLHMHVIAHGIIAGLLFIFALIQLGAATALQSHIIFAHKDSATTTTAVAEGNSLCSLHLVERQHNRKVSVLISLISVGVTALVSYIVLVGFDIYTSDQLNEVIGPLLQYLTVAHLFAGHYSFVHDANMYIAAVADAQQDPTQSSMYVPSL